MSAWPVQTTRIYLERTIKAETKPDVAAKAAGIEVIIIQKLLAWF
jgi:hypothetical protein